ncbi:hypothetical protein DPMN_000627 [Dreissena polymorpha]|uniref:Uncharacterized protein n=1 Tax=Dreissena polymorpha TaxID=45954 RepID=A0A9D4MK42_DREPO|nr:hypothetical protein DPMN_000627 [Dreissena polymorpha]
MRFLEKSIHSVFEGLNETSHDLDHEIIRDKSRFKGTAAEAGSSTIMYRLVSSANRRMFAWMSVTMSFM